MIKLSPAVLMVCVGTIAAAALLWLCSCPRVILECLTRDQLIGRSPGGAQEKEVGKRSMRSRENYCG